MTTFDPSPDLAVVDGTETVTLHRRGATPGSPGVEVSRALRRAVSVREAAESNGHYTASDVAWHLPVGELDAPPLLGDVIADSAGRRWTVLEVQLVALRTRWRCAARNLAIVYGLDDTIAVLKARYVQGSDGAMDTAWEIWKPGVRARIQPTGATVKSAGGICWTAERFRVFVAEELALDHNHRIQGPDGAAYQIVGISAAQRIGELQTIEVEKLS